jgi:large subunit ribosomal protein L25
MTTGAIDLELEPRTLIGKKVQRLRRQGIIPVHLYGPDTDSRALQCQSQRLIQALSAAGASTPINITIQGESETQLAFAREIQWDPRRGDIVHVDLLVADSFKPVSAQVAIVLIGESPGARAIGGAAVQQLRFLDVQALPMEMPGQIEIDLETLTESDGVIRAGDLDLPAGVTRLTDADEVMVRVEGPRVEAVTPQLQPEGEGAETAEDSQDSSEETSG